MDNKMLAVAAVLLLLFFFLIIIIEGSRKKNLGITLPPLGLNGHRTSFSFFISL